MRPLFLVVGASVLALSFPAAFERYRDEMAAPSPEEAPTAPGLTEAALPKAPAGSRVLRIAADADGHFRAQGSLNGRATSVLVDTGATYVALGERDARRLGLAVAPAEFRHEARTANGSTPAARATIARLRVGPLELRDVEAMVLKGDLDEVLLGMSFLGRLRTVEMRDGALELRP